jgi:hypothetical protein
MTATHHHLGRAIMLCLARARLTGMDAASQIGISQSGLVRLISGARRADSATLTKLSRATLWRDHPHAGQQIMIGHLMDELERAGWRASDILMRARGNRQYAMRALHEIEEHIAAGDEAVAELVVHVADILRRAALADVAGGRSDDRASPPIAAEETSEYRPADPKKPSAKTRMRTKKSQP